MRMSVGQTRAGTRPDLLDTCRRFDTVRYCGSTVVGSLVLLSMTDP